MAKTRKERLKEGKEYYRLFVIKKETKAKKRERVATERRLKITKKHRTTMFKDEKDEII